MHGKICAEHAKKLLQSIRYPDKKAKMVCEIIKEHEWSLQKKRSIESQILYEADKIDAFGVFGVLRYMYFLAELKIPFTLEIETKRLEIVEKSFKTKTGKALLKPRMKRYKQIFMEAKNEKEGVERGYDI